MQLDQPRRHHLRLRRALEEHVLRQHAGDGPLRQLEQVRRGGDEGRGLGRVGGVLLEGQPVGLAVLADHVQPQHRRLGLVGLLLAQALEEDAQRPLLEHRAGGLLLLAALEGVAGDHAPDAAGGLLLLDEGLPGRLLLGDELAGEAGQPVGRDAHRGGGAGDQLAVGQVHGEGEAGADLRQRGAGRAEAGEGDLLGGGLDLAGGELQPQPQVDGVPREASPGHGAGPRLSRFGLGGVRTTRAPRAAAGPATARPAAGRRAAAARCSTA